MEVTSRGTLQGFGNQAVVSKERFESFQNRKERHYGQALVGMTTRVKVFAEDSEFRSLPFGGPQGQDFGSRLGRRDNASS